MRTWGLEPSIVAITELPGIIGRCAQQLKFVEGEHFAFAEGPSNEVWVLVAIDNPEVAPFILEALDVPDDRHVASEHALNIGGVTRDPQYVMKVHQLADFGDSTHRIHRVPYASDVISYINGDAIEPMSEAEKGGVTLVLVAQDSLIRAVQAYEAHGLGLDQDIAKALGSGDNDIVAAALEVEAERALWDTLFDPTLQAEFVFADPTVNSQQIVPRHAERLMVEQMPIAGRDGITTWPGLE